MDSSSEAFDKFSTWKNLKTSLRVTVIEKGETKDVLTCSLFAVDPVASQIGIVLGMHKFSAFDVEESVFSVEPKRVVVTRNESDWLVFEEIS
jgi:hypothetical protein